MQTLPATTINQALHEAKIVRRASRLFSTEGYRFRRFDTSSHLYFVYPADSNKAVYIVNLTNQTCTCTGHELNGLCSHRLAIEEVAYDDARYEAEATAYEMALLEVDGGED